MNYNEKIYEKVVFDIGANNGSSTIDIAKTEPNTIVFAFEPTPELVEHIKEQTKDITNYIIIEKAVSNYTGKAKFNLMKKYDWGCSSLLEFSDTAFNENVWGTPPWEVTDTIEVDVITLDTFLKENNVQKIDYLHIDTQGSDLNVLKGMGEYINIVEAGVMEAGAIADVLYKGQNTKDECIEFLESNGFGIENITRASKDDLEINLHFKKK
jgi:FkbM family methyltransferase